MKQSYSVPGISCQHCKVAIEAEVGALADVDEVTVDVEGRTVVVVGEISDEAVRLAIEEAGYQAV